MWTGIWWLRFGGLRSWFFSDCSGQKEDVWSEWLHRSQLNFLPRRLGCTWRRAGNQNWAEVCSISHPGRQIAVSKVFGTTWMGHFHSLHPKHFCGPERLRIAPKRTSLSSWNDWNILSGIQNLGKPAQIFSEFSWLDWQQLFPKPFQPRIRALAVPPPWKLHNPGSCRPIQPSRNTIKGWLDVVCLFWLVPDTWQQTVFHRTPGKGPFRADNWSGRLQRHPDERGHYFHELLCWPNSAFLLRQTGVPSSPLGSASQTEPRHPCSHGQIDKFQKAACSNFLDFPQKLLSTPWIRLFDEKGPTEIGLSGESHIDARLIAGNISNSENSDITKNPDFTSVVW